MKRFIRYLYEYQNGQRIRNVGFVKVEQQDEDTVVHIHGKGLRLTGDKTLKVYIFYQKGGQCIGIWQGDIEHVNPAVNYRLAFTPEDTGRRENYPLIEGVILENANRRRFAAVWDDTPAAVEEMRPWKDEPEPDILEMTRKRAEEEMNQAQEAAGGTESDTVSEAARADGESMEARRMARELSENGNSPVGGMSGEDWIDTGDDEDGAEMDAGQIEERRRQQSRMRTPQPDQQGIRYMKIRRQDIARLKRCEWRLANNSFLLHGYYNYHHLLLIEDDERCMLGVPGVYHAREAQAAAAFGFPLFQRIADDAVELEENERNEVDDFGYWCRQVRK